MKLSPAQIAEIKAAHPLDDLIAARVKLSRARGGIRRGPCLCQPSPGKEPLWVKDEAYGCFRSGGQCGGDIFAYLEQHEGRRFDDVVQQLGGKVSRTDWAAREQEMLARRAAQAQQDALKREQARAYAWDIWRAGRPAQGSPVAAYLGWRGLDLPIGCRTLRYAPNLPYRHDGGLIHSGPAMLAAIQAVDGRFIGVHRTWLHRGFVDGALPVSGSGKAQLPDGLPAKKMLGIMRGGAIRLTAPAGCEGASAQSARAPCLIIGEGIETVLSVVQAMREEGPAAMALHGWAAGSLGNLAGDAARDAQGRVQPDVPDMDRCGIELPDWAAHVILLGDGDSNAAATQAAMARAHARGVAQGRTVEVVFAPKGQDFNDMLGVGL